MGATRSVCHGVQWIRMAMPMALNHINLWAIKDGPIGDVGAGWAVVDTGVQTLDVANAWRKLFSEGKALRSGPVTRILVTHMHPDHVGMAGWIARKFNCRMWMTRLEYLNCRVLIADTGREAPMDAVSFYQRAGWSEENLEAYRVRFGSFGRMIHPLPDSYGRLQDGDPLQIGDHIWRAIVGSGHSPEHACFYCEDLKLFISGDQVLPRISSNVSVFPTEPDADPLSDWLGSLKKIRHEVADDVIVLPAHNEPFRGLHARLDALAKDHHQSLDRLLVSLREPKRVVDLFSTLFSRPITGDGMLLGLATGETLAHLNYLLKRREIEICNVSDGVAYYQVNASRSGAPDSLSAAARARPASEWTREDARL